MNKIKLMNKISPIGLAKLNQEQFICGEDVEMPDGILVRSASLNEMEMPSSLKAIARAGAGVNNIPVDKCSDLGIVVFNTPGANANAVKELVLAGLLLSSRKIIDGVQWAKTLADKGVEVPKLVEKSKSEFVGPELDGKTLGVIGLGAIGVMVANSAKALGMEVIGYDPYISVDAAWGLSRSINKAKTLNEIFEKSDYITVHVPLNDETEGFINNQSISGMKAGVKILNFSRGELVNNDDIGVALDSGKVSCYVTDFPNANTLKMKNVIAIPHLGASTPESEENCAVMAAKEIRNFLLCGTIKNSVNFPDIDLPKTEFIRICIMHKNIPTMLSKISTIVGGYGVNIENMLNRSKKENAYTILDIIGDLPDGIISKISAIEGIMKIRVIH